MDSQMNDEERIRKFRRYSNLFEPECFKKHSIGRPASIGAPETSFRKKEKRQKRDKTVKETNEFYVIEKSILSVEFNELALNSPIMSNKKNNKALAPTKGTEVFTLKNKTKLNSKSKKSITKPKVEENHNIDEKDFNTDENILKIYTDKTIKQSKNLETIFEIPHASNIMGKRKLRRSINFNNTNSLAKAARRHRKVNKFYPNFKMSFIDYSTIFVNDVFW
ncbi:unnamed protein product [Phyllotreta striolata]|uniref:Uncharacterized protein n=1 Tax=Phyllotreta striolata TaxID=444603 RepID=A0A9N9XPM2_PHYSR|nr:unnamed protein product [Phyllotreta striolata]